MIHAKKSTLRCCPVCGESFHSELVTFAICEDCMVDADGIEADSPVFQKGIREATRFCHH